VTFNGTFDFEAEWSPDGQRIAFATAGSADFDIATIRPDGSDLQFLTDDPADDMAPTWSPDGLSIAFQSDRLVADSPQVFTMPSSGEPETLLTTSPNVPSAFEPSWSPDGTLIAHAASIGGEIVIAVTPATGGSPMPLSDGADFSPSWQSLGKKLPTLRCDGVLATIEGTGGDDDLVGTPLVDVVVALDGGDDIRVAGDDDVVCAGPGDDGVLGQGGNDRIESGHGNDTAKGGGGGDGLFGQPGNDTLVGGPGRDAANGGPGRDACSAEVERNCERPA
jgi:Ca2+-binding RTX toxin-like protein